MGRLVPGYIPPADCRELRHFSMTISETGAEQRDRRLSRFFSGFTNPPAYNVSAPPETRIQLWSEAD